MEKRIFDYDKMDPDKWQDFTNATEEFFNSSNLQSMRINSAADLNANWLIIKKGIMDAAISTIHNHKSVNQHKEIKPKNLLEAHGDIKYVNKLLSWSNTKNLNYNINFLKKSWYSISQKIHSIAAKHNYNFPFP